VQPPAIPPYDSFLWPVITAVRATGDSGSNDEIVTTVLERSELTEDQQQVLHGEGPQTEIAYRLAWARTYLKGMGLLNNSQRGVWNLTETGKTLTEDQIPELHRQYKLRIREARKAKPPAEAPILDDEVDGHGQSDELHWRDAVLAALMAMTPGAFERLAQRLLREAGFTSTTVTGRSGDGGIDGVGTYRMSLVSFPVFFQCKRYSGSVGPSVVRDFRGAMAGRGDKGLLITTGTFTTEAKVEATRDGAPPIDLIDGQNLSDLLKTYGLGVTTTIREVEDIGIDPEFFKGM
jgi:restriction system protein